ncbi:MAG: alcohol dehydrogenase catalytic domain-containing protein, partial [Mariprofundales bacterium]|nr:alcohol dehydrogenase catalytic domain-containing protein [Mariprofundales bacterium]
MKMQAVVMTAIGGEDVLRSVHLPRPEVKSGHQVLVRLHAAGVNPIDAKLRSRGLYIDRPLPAILGCDGAGVVEQVGGDVEGVAVGDQVFYCYGGLGQECGNYAEYAVVDSRYLAPLPAGLDMVTAAASPL